MENRLIIISGKGGVGKTIFGLSLTLDLISKGKRVLYNHFDQEPPGKLCKALKIPVIQLTDEECIKSYVTKKLGSKILASWLIKAPFFNSLFNILPGLKNLVYLGYLLNLLFEDPDLVIVLDCPSSGHALTLLESPANFRNILKTGPLVKDINIIEKHLENPDFTKMIILFLPTILALHEAEELRNGVLKLNLVKPELILNDAFSNIPNLGPEIPAFLKEKLKIEDLVLQEYMEKFGQLKNIIPHIPQTDKKSLIKEMKSVIGRFHD